MGSKWSTSFHDLENLENLENLEDLHGIILHTFFLLIFLQWDSILLGINK